MGKLTVLAAGAIGYVLGARAGQERYEQIKDAARRVRQNPTVQARSQQVADAAKDRAGEVAHAARDAAAEKASSVAAAAKERVSGGSDPDPALVEELHPDSTARQEDPYPRGDLP